MEQLYHLSPAASLAAKCQSATVSCLNGRLAWLWSLKQKHRLIKVQITAGSPKSAPRAPNAGISTPSVLMLYTHRHYRGAANA